EISADHFPDSGLQVTTGHVLMGLARLQHRLLADDAFSFHFARREPRIKDIPAPPLQLDGEVATVFNRDAIGKHIVMLAGTRVGGLVLGLNGYFDSLGDFSDHSVKNINFFYFTSRTEAGPKTIDHRPFVFHNHPWSLVMMS